jgi:hypothetical protein
MFHCTTQLEMINAPNLYCHDNHKESIVPAICNEFKLRVQGSIIEGYLELQIQKSYRWPCTTQEYMVIQMSQAQSVNIHSNHNKIALESGPKFLMSSSNPAD